jgi:hypothetical protein
MPKELKGSVRVGYYQVEIINKDMKLKFYLRNRNSGK